MGLEISSPPLHRWLRNRTQELRGEAPACNTAGRKAYPATSGITTLGFWILLQGFHSWRKRRSCRSPSGATREVSGQPGRRRLPGWGTRSSAGGRRALRPTGPGSAWPPGWLERSEHVHPADLDSLAIKRGVLAEQHRGSQSSPPPPTSPAEQPALTSRRSSAPPSPPGRVLGSQARLHSRWCPNPARPLRDQRWSYAEATSWEPQATVHYRMPSSQSGCDPHVKADNVGAPFPQCLHPVQATSKVRSGKHGVLEAFPAWLPPPFSSLPRIRNV